MCKNGLKADELIRVVTAPGLEIPAIGAGQAWGEEGLSYTDPDPALRAAAIERTLAHIPFAAQTGAAIIVGLLRGVVEPGVSQEQAMDWPLDTFHANIEEPLIKESIRACGDRLFHVHVADSNRWYPGAGHIDFGSVLEALRATGYDGYVSGEFMPLPDADTAAQKGIAYLRRF